jgi:hypothetical protein
MRKEGLKIRLNGPKVTQHCRQVEAPREHNRGGEGEMIGPGMTCTVKSSSSPLENCGNCKTHSERLC